MTVYFIKEEDKKQIGLGENIEDCYKIITEFLNERNYKSPYWRIAKYLDHEWIDVGSYTQFFEIYF